MTKVDRVVTNTMVSTDVVDASWAVFTGSTDRTLINVGLTFGTFPFIGTQTAVVIDQVRTGSAVQTRYNRTIVNIVFTIDTVVTSVAVTVVRDWPSVCADS